MDLSLFPFTSIAERGRRLLTFFLKLLIVASNFSFLFYPCCSLRRPRRAQRQRKHLGRTGPVVMEAAEGGCSLKGRQGGASDSEYDLETNGQRPRLEVKRG